MIVVGGDNGKVCFDSGEVFSFDTKQWTPLSSPMSTPRDGARCAMLGRHLVVCGGFGNGSYLKSCEALDVDTMAWHKIADMTTPRFSPACVAVSATRLVVAGGNDTQDTCLTSAEMYDMTTDTWTPLPPMSTPRTLCGCVLWQGCVVVIGGFTKVDGEWKQLDSCEMYNPTTNTWSAFPSLTTVRNGVAAVVYNGKIHAIGGDALDTVEVYDGPKEQGTVLPATLNTSRWLHTACVVDGRLVVAGGCGDGDPLSTCVWYNEEEDRWELLPNMLEKREQACSASFTPSA